MPVRPLPQNLVKRIQRDYSKYMKFQKRKYRSYGRPLPPKPSSNPWLLLRFDRLFAKMRNMDHRIEMVDEETIKEIYNRDFGSGKGPLDRVREVNVSRNYPALGKVVIKRIDEQGTAREFIRTLKKIVRDHNLAFKNSEKRYVLKSPFVYPLGDKFCFMAKTDAPSLVEMIGLEKSPQTARGKKLLDELHAKHGITKEYLSRIAEDLFQRTYINKRNFLVLGFEKGRLVIMPLADIY